MQLFIIQCETYYSNTSCKRPQTYMCVLTRDVNSSLQFVVKWSSSVEMPWIARFLRLKSSGLSVLTGLPIERDTSNASTVGILNINLEEL